MIDPSAVASVLGIATEFKDLRGGRALFLPQRIAVFAQGQSGVSFSTEKWQSTGAGAAGARFGFKSPIHLILRELQPANGDGVGSIPVTVYPLEDGYEAVAATGSITPVGVATKAGEYRVRGGGILSAPFVIDPTDTVATMCDKIVAAMAGVLHLPLNATDGTTQVALEAPWAGPTGDDIYVEVLGPSLGVTFTIVQPTGGLVNPDVTDALAQVGNVWETMALNGLNIADTDTLDLFQEFGEGRWNQLVRKPWVVFTGNTEAVFATATAVSAARPLDRVNSQLVAPGSVNLPCVVAARQLARIAVVANGNPPTDYNAQRCESLLPGTDGEQWDWAVRDLANKAGSSTIEVKDSVINIADVVTFWRPTGEEPPAYRDVVDIVKLQNTIFNIDIVFAQKEWAAAPLIPDDEPTANANARKPKTAKTQAAAIVDGLADQAILVNRKEIKKSITVSINSQNPKRLDMEMTVQISGNTKVKSFTLYWGFFFGTAAAA